MSDSLASLKNVSKSFTILRQRMSIFQVVLDLVRGDTFYRKQHVLKQISFSIKKGDRLALIGANGAGKTTLLRIIAGIYQPTSGEVIVGKRPSVLFRMNTGMLPELNVPQNIKLGAALMEAADLCNSEMIKQIVEFAELSNVTDLPARKLSAGQTQRLAISIFLFFCNDFIIIDESFAYLDQKFLFKCHSKLNELMEKGKSMILCSHDLQFLKRYCSRGVWLQDGAIKESADFETVALAYTKGLS